MQNVETTADQVQAITSHNFTNKLLCAEAVQMASPQVAAVYEGASRGVDNNKRLSILGDAVLAKVLCAAWFEARGTNDRVHSPAIWTILRNEILGNDALATRGYDLSVDKCIFVADGTYRKSPKMVATTLEAIIGAVFQDGGDEAVMRVIQHLGFLEHRLLTIPYMAAIRIPRTRHLEFS